MKSSNVICFMAITMVMPSVSNKGCSGTPKTETHEFDVTLVFSGHWVFKDTMKDTSGIASKGLL